MSEEEEATSKAQPENGQQTPPPVVKPNPQDKIEILLKPTGSTARLSKSKWKVTRERTVGWISDFVKNILKMEAGQTLFFYVKQTFAPAADVDVGTVYDSFGSDGKLVLHYCATEAWG